MKNLFKFVIGWPLTIVALFFIGKIIFSNIGSIVTSVVHLNFYLFFLSIISFVTYFFIRVYFWQALLRLKGHDLSMKEISYVWGFSEMKRYVPGNVWSILSRANSFGEWNIPRATVFSSFAIEAIFIVLSSLLLCLFSLNFLIYGLLPKFAFPSYLEGFIIFFVFLFILCILANRFLFSLLREDWLSRFIKKIIPHFSFIDNFYLLIICTFAMFFFGLGVYLSISAVVLLYPPYLLTLVGFSVFSLLVGYLSFITPMGLGVREGIMTLGLAKFISVSLAGFGAIFSRIIFILSELIFLGISFAWYKNTHPHTKRLVTFIERYRYEILLVIFISLYVFYFSAASFAKYDNFFAGRFDLGNMDQTVWNTIHGRIFQLTDPNGTQSISRLAFHADFILILLAPFYLLWQDPRMLLFIQSVMLGSGAFFVFLLGKHILRRKSFALFFSLLYLLNPAMQDSNLYDFHGVVLATTFLLGAFYFLKSKRYFWYGIFLFLAGITKEEIWIVTAFLGLYTIFFEKKKVSGSFIFLFSCGIFYYLLWHAIPGIRGSGHFALSYYSDFGSSPGEIIKTMFFSPGKTVSTLLKNNVFFYSFELLLPVGFLSLAAPASLLFALPDFAVNILSNNPQLHQIYYQYTAPITPFLFISALYGFARIQQRFPMLSRRTLSSYLLLTALVSSYVLGPMIGDSTANLDMFTRPLAERDTISTFLNSIPLKFSVAASNNLGSHLSHRQNIYTIPVGIGQADIILFLLNDQYAQPSLKAQKQMVESMKRDKNYIEIFKLGDFVVFEKRNLYIQDEPDAGRANLYPLSIPALQQRDFIGGDIRIEKQLQQTNVYTSYLVSYHSDGLKLYALLHIPHDSRGKNMFPVVIVTPGNMAPSYPAIDPYQYVITFFASHGFMVFEPQYRGKGNSESDIDLPSSISYPVDVLNLFSSVLTFPQVDVKNIFLWGHGTGGAITLTAIEAHDGNKNFKDAIKGAVLRAPTIDPRMGYKQLQTYFPSLSAQLTSSTSGGRVNPSLFLNSFLPIFYTDDIRTPIEIDQGMADIVVSYQWSIEFYSDMLSANKKAYLHLYPNETHSFSQDWRRALVSDLYFFRTLIEK